MNERVRDARFYATIATPAPQVASPEMTTRPTLHVTNLTASMKLLLETSFQGGLTCGNCSCSCPCSGIFNVPFDPCTIVFFVDFSSIDLQQVSFCPRALA